MVHVLKLSAHNKEKLSSLVLGSTMAPTNFPVLLVIAVFIAQSWVTAKSSRHCVVCKGRIDKCSSQALKPSSTLHECQEECMTLVIVGSADDPEWDHEDIYIRKGCSTASDFEVFDCIDKCYDTMQEVPWTFGNYSVCAYCCSGNECNMVTPGGFDVDFGLQMNGDIFASVLSVVLSLTIVYARLS